MTFLPIDQFVQRFPMLFSQLGPGDEIVLTDGNTPIARVIPVEQKEALPKRRRGTAKGVLTIISEDDEHLEDFAEYM